MHENKARLVWINWYISEPRSVSNVTLKRSSSPCYNMMETRYCCLGFLYTLPYDFCKILWKDCFQYYMHSDGFKISNLLLCYWVTTHHERVDCNSRWKLNRVTYIIWIKLLTLYIQLVAIHIAICSRSTNQSIFPKISSKFS